MKTLTLGTLLTSMWQSPVIALLIAIALVFIAHFYSQYLESKKITCVVIDFTAWSYRDIQILAKSHSIKANSKRGLLINLLQSKYSY